MKEPATGDGRRAELIVSGLDELPARTVLALAADLRRILARLEIGCVSIRLAREEIGRPAGEADAGGSPAPRLA